MPTARSLIRIRQDGSEDTFYLGFNGIYSAVHVSEAGTVQTFCGKERQTKRSSISTKQQTHMLLLLHLSFPFSLRLCLVSFIPASFFVLAPSAVSLYLTLSMSSQDTQEQCPSKQTREFIRNPSLNHVTHSQNKYY